MPRWATTRFRRLPVLPLPTFLLSESEAMFGLGFWELLIVFGIILLLFGSSRLPSLMRNLGRSVVEFKQGMRDEGEAEKEEEVQAAKHIE